MRSLSKYNSQVTFSKTRRKRRAKQGEDKNKEKEHKEENGRKRKNRALENLNVYKAQGVLEGYIGGFGEK
jgi:hypothetical protein